MPTIYQLKPAFQACLRPLTRALARAGVTPNQVTVAALLLSIATGLAVWWLQPDPRVMLAVPVVLFARMALNAIDGMLAREHDLRSRLGALLNELSDVLSDAALYFPLAFVAGMHPAFVVAAVFLAAVSEMAGVLGSQINASRRFDGPMGKSDRAFAFGAVYLALGLGAEPGLWTNVVLVVLILLLLVTILNRARRALREAPCQS